MSRKTQLINTREATKHLHLTQRVIQRWCKEGKLASARKIGKNWFISRSEVEKIERGEAPISVEALEALQQSETTQGISEELLPAIRKLARRLQWLIYIPEPELPLLSSKSDMEVTTSMVDGNYSPYLKLVRTMNIPWWCINSSVHVYLPLSPEDEALYKRLIELPICHKLKTALNKWFNKTNYYLNLVRLKEDEERIKVAYKEAKEAASETHSELWEAVEALR